MKAAGAAREVKIAEEAQSAGVEGSRQVVPGTAGGTVRASGLTARKKFGGPAIQRVPSGERPPPGTTQWTMWMVRQRSAPRCAGRRRRRYAAPSRRGLAASAVIASAAALNRIA